MNGNPCPAGGQMVGGFYHTCSLLSIHDLTTTMQERS